jgi:negative regulator of flagellin synthesis FlgM
MREGCCRPGLGKEFSRMSEINPVVPGQVGRVTGVGPTVGRNVHVSEDSTVRRGTDRVEVSPVALYLNKLKDLPIRQDLVDTVRQQIAQGTYDTPDKLDAAVNELLNDAQPL